jgi:hypothetical protein
VVGYQKASTDATSRLWACDSAFQAQQDNPPLAMTGRGSSLNLFSGLAFFLVDSRVSFSSPTGLHPPNG